MQKINDLSAKITTYQVQISASIDRVLASGTFISGAEVKQFEQSFAHYIGASHCVSLANGTDAIELSLKATGAGPKQRIATVANAGMYATTAILSTGAQPYFMDVDQKTQLTTLAEVKRAIAAGVSTVIVTHLYGIALPEIEAIANYCATKNITLLEDCAQAHGARINGQTVGTFSDAASFSFYPTKNLGALGDGGAVITRSEELAKKIKRLRQYGWTSKYTVEAAGARNSRLDEIQAAILNDFLPHLDKTNNRRREIAAIYSQKIHHPDISCPPQRGDNSVAHLYVIRCRHRDKLRHYLDQLNIATDIHYPIPDHHQPLFAELFSHIHLPNTEQLAAEVLTLPCYPEMKNAQVDHVIQSINNLPK